MSIPRFGNQKITERYEWVKDKKGNVHGPYLYLYWKENGKLKKCYFGKNKIEYEMKQICKTLAPHMNREYWTFRQWQKWERLMDQSLIKKNKLAEEYLERVINNEITIDWAFKYVFSQLHKHGV